MTRLQLFLFHRLPVLVLCVAIFVQSSFSAPEVLPVYPHSDKLLHFLCYALLGALFLRAFLTSRLRNRLDLLVWLSIICTALYGISDEVHQAFIPLRNASSTDAMADILGGIFGVLLYRKTNGNRLHQNTG
jgi:VanZ family protein